MTNPDMPSEEQLDNTEPDRDSVVVREDDEGVRVQVNFVAGSTVDETTARTYSRSFGHYFLGDSATKEEFNDLLEEFKTDESVIDRSSLPQGQAVELTVEISDEIKQSSYDFIRSNEVILEIPSHSTKHLDSFDSLLETIESQIQD